MTEKSELQSGNASNERSKLTDIASVFLRLGLTSFGGPAAHIAMMERELVQKKQWLTHDTFVDLLGATNIIPGPNSTEMALHIGYLRARLAGLIVAGKAFILPSFFMVAIIAALYVQYGTLPAVQDILYGVKPVVVAVIFCALWRLSRTAIKSNTIAIVSMLCAVAYVCGIPQLPLLLLTGSLAALIHWYKQKSERESKALALILLITTLLIGVPLVVNQLSPHDGSAPIPFSLWTMFWYFLKLGSILYGSGYVLLAFLQVDLVQHWHWLAQAQLLDATAVGQITPGPVFTTATFIGYVLAGPLGAVVATIGIFLPAFVFVALSGALVPHIRKSKLAGQFLDGVNAASLILMTVVTLELGYGALQDVPTIAIALASTIILFRLQINSAWLMLAGGLLGLLLHLAVH